MRLRRASLGVIVPVIALLARLSSEGGASASYLVIAAYALSGRAQAIQALALSWLFSMINPALAPIARFDSIGRYAVILAAAASVLVRSGFLRHSPHVSRPVMVTLFVGAFLVAHSLIFSPLAEVSVLKSLSWAFTMATLLAAWGGLESDARERVARQIFGGLTIVLFLSIPLLVHPLGYLRNGTGFQGVLGHPQTFGPAIALLAAASATRMLAQPHSKWWQLIIAGMAALCVVLSEARTAGVALVLAIVVASLCAPLISGMPLRQVFPGLRSSRVQLTLFLAFGCGLLAAPFLSSQIGSYISKGNSVESVAEAYDESRGGLVQQMWANIQEKPLYGIGFGISSDPTTMIIERDPFFDLPVSAPVEKGVLPVMLLEEIGLVGTSVMALWLWMILRRTARHGDLVALSVLLTALLLNMGEATLFSPGGLGMLLLILIAWATTSQRSSRPRNA